MPKVVIVQTAIKQYRVSFFVSLAKELQLKGVELVVIYGKPTAAEANKRDNVSLPSTFGVEVRNHWLLGGRVLYQPLWPEIRHADLVIVEQANKHLMNYLLLIAARMGIKRMGFWGHGRNRQGRDGILGAAIKRRSLTWANWWFAYTLGTKNYLVDEGVSPHQITNVQNSVDTDQFRTQLAQVCPENLVELRRSLGLGHDARVCLYCGSLYRDKRLELLLESASEIAREVPTFRLLIVGDGPQRQLVADAEARYPWVRYVGAKFGSEKAAYFSLAELFLHPGAIGLAVLDAFVAGVPVITTDIPIHGPEVEYLVNDVNGVITVESAETYAGEVVRLFNDREHLERLRREALRSAEHYSVRAMVDNMTQGILDCLEAEQPSGTVRSRV